MKRWWAILPLAGIVLLVILAYVRLTDASTAPDGRTFDSPVRPAPAHVFPRLDGGEGRSLAAQGQPVLVNFWASWCVPCRAEHPYLLKLQSQGVPIAGILYKDSDAAGRSVLDGSGNPFAEVLTDASGDGGIAFGISGVPESFLIDAQGQIVWSHRGPVLEKEAGEALAAWNSLAR